MVLSRLHARRPIIGHLYRYRIAAFGAIVAFVIAALGSLAAPAEPVAFPAMAKSPIPNAWLSCPAGMCVSANARSAVYDASPADLRAAWDAMIARQPRVERVRLDTDGLGGTWVQSSARFGFRDRINVRFLTLPDGRATLAAHSRSEIGLYDFGVNRRRLETWLGELAVPGWRFRLSPVPSPPRELP
jgi:uncharacterized protein (DUF1499 family)